MGMLTKLIKTAISAVLLNKAMRSAFLAALIKSVNWMLQPSGKSKIMAFFSRLIRPATASAGAKGISSILSVLFKGAAELLLLRFARKKGFLGPVALSALAALLLNMFKERGEKKGTNSRRQNGRIIDHDDYTILDEGH
ncbi:MAG TPA: hypothetical protein PKK68_09135 [Methanothrix soehngenii]|nr:hypothetical protein [Methanothrix soehngenii]